MRLLLGLSIGVVAALPIACSSSRKSAEQALVVTPRDSGGVEVYELSLPLDVRTATFSSTLLSSNLTLGGVDAPFEDVADVAGLPGEGFAVLDRSAGTVLVFDRNGTVTRRFGRKGKGPGEFADPTAVVYAGSRFIVRDLRTRVRQPLLIFDSAGRYIDWTGAALAGDWDAQSTRSMVFPLSDGSHLMPAEDLTRRLMDLEDGRVAYVLEPAFEFYRTDPVAHPPAYLISFDLEGNRVDTVDRSVAPTDFPGVSTKIVDPRPGEQEYFRHPWQQEWYGGRPVWAVGHGWRAHAHGDSLTVSVQDTAGGMRALIKLQPGEVITEADKLQFTDWYYREFVLKHGSKDNRKAVESLLGTPEMEPYSKQIIAAMRWAARAPTITGLYADGDCLWLGGFAPKDHPSGAALTWAVVNVRTGGSAVYRLPRPGTRLREVRDGLAYATYQDEDGLPHLERYPAACQ